MSMAIRIPRNGGPEVLEWQAVDVPPPGPGEAQVRHHAVGLNYIDVYHRNVLYPLPLPSGIGVEGFSTGSTGVGVRGECALGKGVIASSTGGTVSPSVDSAVCCSSVSSSSSGIVTVLGFP